MLLPLSLTYYLSFSFFILTELFGFVFHPLCTCSIFQQSITLSFPWVWVLGSPQHRSDWCSQWGPGDPVKLPPAPLYLWGSWYSHRSTATLSPGQGTASNIAHKASIRKCKAMYTHTHTLTQCNSYLDCQFSGQSTAAINTTNISWSKVQLKMKYSTMKGLCWYLCL